MNKPNFDTLGRFPICIVGICASSFVIMKVARDTLFFQGEGIYQLPLGYIWIAIASIPFAWIHLLAMRYFGAQKTRTGIILLFAVVFLALIPFLEHESKFSVMFLFVAVPTVFSAIFAAIWLQIGELFTGADRKLLHKMYSRIGASSMIGGIIGGAVARELSNFLKPEYLIAFAAVLLLFAGLLVSFVNRRYLKTISKGSDIKLISDTRISLSLMSSTSRSTKFYKKPYVIAMAGISTLLAFVALLIDFQFYAIVTISGNIDLKFFANFYIFLNATSLFLQLVVTPRLQHKFGIGGTLYILPFLLLCASLSLFLWNNIIMRSILRITEGSIKSSIHRSTWEQTYLPLPDYDRWGMKILIEGVAVRVAEGFCALILLFWISSLSNPISELSLEWITWMIISGIILWLMSTRYLQVVGCGDIKPGEIAIRLPEC